MGDQIRLNCRKCDKSYDLAIGHGMADNRIDTVLTYFDDDKAEVIRAALASAKDGGQWSYRKMIGYCDKCRSYFEIPTFHITDNDKEQIVAAKCRCGNDCMIFDDDDKTQMAGLKCPGCSSVMTVETTGMWD